jgi:DNA-binding transcriptional ArsR family regulator
MYVRPVPIVKVPFEIFLAVMICGKKIAYTTGVWWNWWSMPWWICKNPTSIGNGIDRFLMGREEILNEPKKKVLILGSESIGRGDETLGFEILVNLLETLSKRDDGPAAIICWNTAVKLMAEGSSLLVHLKRLEEKGINILAGQLCVRELELMNKIAVGRLATMDEILDLILNNDVLAL